MKFGTVILAALAVSIAPDAASAQGEPATMQGAALLASCRANDPQCGAYLQGIADMLILRQSLCDAPRYDRGALRAAYLRWANGDTYFWDKHMMAGAERALTEAWPCRARP